MVERNVPWKLSALVALVVGLGCGVGCSETVKDPENDNTYQPLPDWTDERPPSEKKLEPQPLGETVFVDAEKVETLRSDKHATVVDARPLGSYEDGHLPGAVHSGHGDPEGFKPFKDSDYNDTVPRDVSQLQATARDMGVFNDRPVVIYGTPGSKKAGRLFWALEYLGHGDVYLYTPGFETLVDELGVEPSTETASKDGDFVVRRRGSVLATNDDVRKVSDGEKEGVLIDTRRKSEYTGDEIRAPRHGYIPNAEYYHWEDIFVSEGETTKLKSKAELNQALENEGLLKKNQVLIPYCQTGTRSAYVYAALRWVGAEKPQNYDGSWARYARLEGAPVKHDGDQQLDGEK